MVLTPAADDQLCDAMIKELCGPPAYAVETKGGKAVSVERLAQDIKGLTQQVLKTQKRAEEPEACICAVCQDVFVEPVTLKCGHSFDRRCLVGHLELRRDCPLCRAPVALPLPELNFALRDLVAEMCPVRASARAAELRDEPRKAPAEEPRLLQRVLHRVDHGVGLVSTVTALAAATAASVLLARA